VIESAGRFYLIVCTVTITVMYGAFVHLLPLIQTMFAPSWTVILGGTIIASITLYKLIAWAVELILSKWLWFKSRVFGASFMHGTWIGYFRGHDDDLRYIVEHFEQNFEGLVIRGQSFDEQGKEHAHWVSLSTSIDAKSGRLSYLSLCDILSRNVTVQSVCVFQLERDDQSNMALALHGYAVDVNDGIRIAVTESKIDMRLLPIRSALQRAKEMASASSAHLGVPMKMESSSPP